MLDQEDSYEAQEQYFTKLLAAHPDWNSVGVYSDYGISGTMQDTRTGLKRLIRHCEEGKINRIICKSISRFSRNTANTLQIIRQLQNLGVTMFFEKEGLDTADLKSEFILTTLAALAQEESRSISENIRWGLAKRMPKGDVPNEALFGYRLGQYETTKTGYKRRTAVIVEDEAEIVRRIFTLFIDGHSALQIARILNGEHVPAPNETIGGTGSQIAALLRNERYCGDVLTSKTYTPDYLTHKMKKNHGEVQQFYIQDHHRAIISREIFQMAQKRFRSVNERRANAEYPFTSRLKCPYCGANYQKSNNAWECATVKLRNGKGACKAEKVYEDDLNAMFRNAVLARFQSCSDLYAILEASQDLDFVERDRSIMKKRIAIAETDLYDVMPEYDKVKTELRVREMRAELEGTEKNQGTAEIKQKFAALQEKTDALLNEKKALEDELDAKEKQWELAEKDHETRQTLIDFMEFSTEQEILQNLHFYVKALAPSITVYSPTKFTVLWFDGTETEITT
ncbi:MAG: recombinase family protein [Oscillospiraceae bacterium]|nr:recombinase family protein [Oscillospiraceae bacterium]